MPAIPLKYIVLTNWFLAIWGNFSAFLGLTYLFSNATVFALGVWCLIDKQTMDGFTSFGAAYVFSIISDFMCIGVFAKQDHISDYGDNNQKFTLAMAAINLIAKFAFLYFLWQEYNSRGSAAVDGSTAAPLAGGAYDPIPHNQHQQQQHIGGFQAAAGSFGQPQGSLPPVMQQPPQPIGAQGGMPIVGGSVSGSAGGAYQQPQAGYTGM